MNECRFQPPHAGALRVWQLQITPPHTTPKHQQRHSTVVVRAAHFLCWCTPSSVQLRVVRRKSSLLYKPHRTNSVYIWRLTPPHPPPQANSPTSDGSYWSMSCRKAGRRRTVSSVDNALTETSKASLRMIEPELWGGRGRGSGRGGGVLPVMLQIKEAALRHSVELLRAGSQHPWLCICLHLSLGLCSLFLF